MLVTGSSSDSSNSQLKCAKDIKINTSFLGGHHAGFNHNPTFLLVECISEFWSHEQSLQKAVEITGHSLVDQTDVTWRRAKERKSMQVHEKRHRSGLLRLTCIRFGENRRVRVGWTAVITTAAYGAFSGEGSDEALLRAVVQPAAFSSSRFILKAETGLLGTLLSGKPRWGPCKTHRCKLGLFSVFVSEVEKVSFATGLKPRIGEGHLTAVVQRRLEGDALQKEEQTC